MPTTERTPREVGEQAPAVQPSPDFALSDRDVRRKRPPLLAFLLKLDTLRKIVRVSTLLTIDFFGVYMAIITALWLKAGILTADWRVNVQAQQTRELFDFASC